MTACEDIFERPQRETATMHAEEMRAAAFRIREVAAHAAAGPWTASPVWSSRSHATSAVYSLAHDAGTVASEVVASGRADKSGGIANPFNAVWIAAVYPGFAEPLAAWLEREARHWEAVDVAGATRPDGEGLAVARVINGEAS
jgi:hypothetical protein